MDFFDKDHIFLVVGANNNTQTQGYRVFKDLFDAKYNVIAVGAKGEVVNTPAYQNLSDFFARISKLFDEKRRQEAVRKSVLVLVESADPIEVLHEAIDHGICKVWFQPGMESQEALALCKENDIAQLSGECITVKHP